MTETEEARAPSGGPADALVIAGLVPMSTVDWPDHLSATVFTQGCPWNCFYCHNQALIPARTPGQVAWEEVRALLRRRRGLLDGVVLTGGEALRQDALADAAREVIDMGFQVGLHTAGPYPRRLHDMIEAGLVEWVGLDIKALPEHYGQVVGPVDRAHGDEPGDHQVVGGPAVGADGDIRPRSGRSQPGFGKAGLTCSAGPTDVGTHGPRAGGGAPARTVLSGPGQLGSL